MSDSTSITQKHKVFSVNSPLHKKFSISDSFLSCQNIFQIHLPIILVFEYFSFDSLFCVSSRKQLGLHKKYRNTLIQHKHPSTTMISGGNKSIWHKESKIKEYIHTGEGTRGFITWYVHRNCRCLIYISWHFEEWID